MGAITFQYDILVNRQTVPELTADYTIPTGSTAEKSRDPKGNETTKVTDAAGRLIYVISEGKVTAYSYDENGNRSKVVYPDGKTKEEYEYYKDNLLKKLINIKADGTTMDEYSYSYDGAHNQTSKTEIINGKEKGTTSYSYDKLNRLIKIQEPIKETETAGRITSYTYDAAGNRETERTTTSKAAATKTTLITYKYNEQNRLMSATEETGDGTKKTTTYTYDGNGNMTRKSMEQTRQIDPSNAPKARFGIYIEGQAEGATKNAKPIVSAIASYEYNVWNQLKKATTAEGISTYKYNGEGYRTEKTENGKTTISLYEADKVILEADANGKEIARNLYGTNLITRTVTETENSTTQKTSYNYLYNGHGDVTALLTQDGTIAASYYYDAFGTAVETHYYNASGEETDKAVNNPYRYAGYVFDSTTDLYYLNARYYDSKIARFMSEDTYTGEMNDPLSLNLYTYCANNPVIYTDPTGHFKVSQGDYNNADVKIVQNLLIQCGYDIGKFGADGDFGKDTLEAVNQFKSDHKLTNNTANTKGIVGDTTLDFLIKEASKKQAQNNSGNYSYQGYSNKDEESKKNINDAQQRQDSGSKKGDTKQDTSKQAGTKKDPVITPQKSTTIVEPADNKVKESGVGYAIPMPITSPIPVALPNPWLIGIELILVNLFTPTVVSGGDLTYEQVQQDKAIEKAKTDALTKTITTAKDNPNKGTIIYRWGSGSNTNLTPKEKDITGLSFSLTPPSSGSYCATTLELVNTSGYLIAVQDTANHVSVMPVNPSKMPEWIASRINAETDPHLYTSVLKKIVIKIK